MPNSCCFLEAELTHPLVTRTGYSSGAKKHRHGRKHSSRDFDYPYALQDRWLGSGTALPDTRVLRHRTSLSGHRRHTPHQFTLLLGGSGQPHSRKNNWMAPLTIGRFCFGRTTGTKALVSKNQGAENRFRPLIRIIRTCKKDIIISWNVGLHACVNGGKHNH